MKGEVNYFIDRKLIALTSSLLKAAAKNSTAFKSSHLNL